MKRIVGLVAMAFLMPVFFGSNTSWGQCSDFTVREMERTVHLRLDEVIKEMKKKGYSPLVEGGLDIPMLCPEDSRRTVAIRITTSDLFIVNGLSLDQASAFSADLIQKGYKSFGTPSKEARVFVKANFRYYFLIKIVKTAASVGIFYMEDEMYDEVNADSRVTGESSPASVENSIARRVGTNKIIVDSHTSGTQITLKSGNVVSISATGTVRLGAFAGVGGPDGINGFTGYNRVDGFRHGALLGRIGDGPWFFVGSNGSFTADRNGSLSLIINDGAVSDNEGSFVVEYSLAGERRAPLKATERALPKRAVTPTPSKLPPTQQKASSRPSESSGNYISGTGFPRHFKGTISNKLSNLTTKCEMTLRANDDGSLQLTGETDNVNLYGRWNLKGNAAESYGRKYYLFKGEILLGYEGSSWPLGTSASFIATVEIDGQKMKGSYTILNNYKGVERQEGVFLLH